MSAMPKKWSDRMLDNQALAVGDAMGEEINELRAALASHQGLAAPAGNGCTARIPAGLHEIVLCYPWGTERRLVRERGSMQWISSKQRTGANAALPEMHNNYVNSAIAATVALLAPQPPAVKDPEPLRPPPARTTSDVAYESLSLERRKKLDADMLVMEQQMRDHRRSRERRQHVVPVDVEKRLADRRGR